MSKVLARMCVFLYAFVLLLSSVNAVSQESDVAGQRFNPFIVGVVAIIILLFLVALLYDPDKSSKG